MKKLLCKLLGHKFFKDGFLTGKHSAFCLRCRKLIIF